MDRARLEAQLRHDEGRRLTVYTDSRGLLTVGIGHQLLVGDAVTPSQVATWFQHDLDTAIADCQQLYPTWRTLPAVVQEILVQMCFNLGKTRLARFVVLRAAIARHAWPAAAAAMEDSAWYTQVGDRSKRLVAAMRAVQERA